MTGEYSHKNHTFVLSLLFSNVWRLDSPPDWFGRSDDIKAGVHHHKPLFALMGSSMLWERDSAGPWWLNSSKCVGHYHNSVGVQRDVIIASRFCPSKCHAQEAPLPQKEWWGLKLEKPFTRNKEAPVLRDFLSRHIGKPLWARQSPWPGSFSSLLTIPSF